MTKTNSRRVEPIILCLCALIGTILVLPLTAQTKRIKPDAEHLVFRSKLLINPQTGEQLQNAIIETNGGRILRVGRDGDWPLPAGIKVIDFSDKFVVPGLIDTHGHLYGGMTVRLTTNPAVPTFYLAAGVTTIGDPGSMDPGGDLALRNRIDSGTLPGPRYFLAGEYLEMAPVTVGWMNPLSTPEEARLKVDHWAAMGTNAIKIYANMSGDVMQAAIEEAHEHGLRVWAHVGAVTFQQAMDMGVDQLFHGVLAMADTRPAGVTQRDFQKWEGETAQLDLNQPQIRQVFRQAAAQKVVLTPTVVVMEALEPGLMRQHHMEEQKKYYAPQAWEAIEKMETKPILPLSTEAIKADVAKNLEFVRMANQSGCILSTGTDLVLYTMLPGFSLWREMELFQEAGLKPMEVLRAATINGAYAIGRTDQLGTVEPGKLADFVVLNSDPLANISNVRSVYRVVKGGVVYDPEKLLKPLEGKVY